MSIRYLRKALKMVESKDQEYDIRSYVSNKMDVGQITEDEAVVVDFAIQERTNNLLKR